MQTLTKPRQRCKVCEAGLDEDKMQQFFLYVDRHGLICLNEDGYRMLRVDGMTRREIDRAVTILRSRGLVRTTVSPFGIQVEVNEERASCPAA